MWLAGLKALIGKKSSRRTRSDISDVSSHFNYIFQSLVIDNQMYSTQQITCCWVGSSICVFSVSPCCGETLFYLFHFGSCINIVYFSCIPDVYSVKCNNFEKI